MLTQSQKYADAHLQLKGQYYHWSSSNFIGIKISTSMTICTVKQSMKGFIVHKACCYT